MRLRWLTQEEEAGSVSGSKSIRSLQGCDQSNQSRAWTLSSVALKAGTTIVPEYGAIVLLDKWFRKIYVIRTRVECRQQQFPSRPNHNTSHVQREYVDMPVTVTPDLRLRSKCPKKTKELSPRLVSPPPPRSTRAHNNLDLECRP